MTERELTQEESDKAILEEMGLAEDDSTINDTEEESEEEIEETQEESEEEDSSEEQEEQEETPKPKKGIPKVLAQRNEAREEAKQAKSEVQKLQEELDRLKSEGKGKSEEYLETLIEKRVAQQNEVIEFFESNEELKPYKKEIQDYAKEV